MSGTHAHRPFEGHMHDLEAHVRAVEEDLEYYRAKRLEPRIFYLLRRRVVTFADLLNAHAALRPEGRFFAPRQPEGSNIEARIRYLEEWLDDYVKGIALVSARSIEGLGMVTEDNRKERGDYDDFFKIRMKEHRGTLEERMQELERDLTEYQELLEVLVQALIAREWCARDELERRWRELHVKRPWNGGLIVARAWTDAAFKEALLATGREALREFGVHQGKVGKLVVVENTDNVHNIVVCTLCSCYPYDLLGDTPWWYKHDIYKTRIVRNPRAVIEEMFGLAIPPGKEVRVHDSTSDVRYFVLPERPRGSESLSESELARLVTVDSLIGAGEPLDPSTLSAAREGSSEPPRVRAD